MQQQFKKNVEVVSTNLCGFSNTVSIKLTVYSKKLGYPSDDMNCLKQF